jgi:hypothetical protein
MPALVTDQFRILNTTNFISSVENTENSYYIFVGLPNPDPATIGYGRTNSWNSNTPNPTDNFSYQSHVGDTMLFGKRITPTSVRRLIRRVDWIRGTRYELYRHDYSLTNPSAITQSSRLYDTNYYVMNSEYRVYVCIDNGASGVNKTGNASQDEPLFTDLEPSKAGESGDGYVWKYLFSVSPSDIIKFDSTEYITVPNEWETSANPQIQSVRENANSSINENQIKKIYIEDRGAGYSNGLGQQSSILGDGSGAIVLLDVVGSEITNAVVSSGGKGYTYGVVDLGAINSNATQASGGRFAKLIPMIPPSKGHGYDIYKELGADRVLVYARFDDSTKDFPIDTKFAQVGIVKNPTTYGTDDIFGETQFSTLYSMKFSSITGSPVVGEQIYQVANTTTGEKAYGYVASYDPETNVLKYFRDRSIYYNQTTYDERDYIGISTSSKVLNFVSSASAAYTIYGSDSAFQGSIDVNFSGISTNPTGGRVINLGSTFYQGLSNPDINKGSGDIIYLDNRPLISRNSRQKEDVKIILEF